MYQFKVGGYLSGSPASVQEGCTLIYDDSGPVLLISLIDITTKEAKQLQKGKIEFAVFEKEGILFLLVNIPGVLNWSDAPFHIGMYPDGRQLPEEANENIQNGAGWGLTVIGLESGDGQIKSLRLIGLGTDISREIFRIVRNQKRIDRVECYSKIQNIYLDYSCKRMVKNATATYKVGVGI